MSSLFGELALDHRGRQLNGIGWEIALQLLLKLASSLQGLSGSSKLPLYFVREIFALSGRRQPAKPGNYTISDILGSGA
jgi:hypothetical protein